MNRLTAENLSAGYDGKAAFRNVHLEVKAGEFLAILGPNGSGKTTLLRALAGLMTPMAGRVHPQPTAATVAFAPQVLAPDWPFTVEEFVSLGRAPHAGWWKPLDRADKSAIGCALERLNLLAFRHRRVTELSGGEWQRVRLAKALAQEPQVLLLDEPTAHLDPRFQWELLNELKSLIRERSLAVVVTLHDLNLVGGWADRVAILANSSKLADGIPSEVMTAEILQSAFQLQFIVAAHPITGAPAIQLPGASPLRHHE